MYKNLNIDSLGVSGRQSEIIELALSFGFKGLDLDIADFAAVVQASGLAHARRLLDSSRLKLSSFRLPLDWDQETGEFAQQLEKVKQYAELAQQIGCTRAIATIEPASDARPYHENFELYRRRCAELAQLLGEHGIRLGLGFRAPAKLRRDHVFPFIQTAEGMLVLLKSISGKNVGLAFDAWNWQLGGGTLDQLTALTADKIATVALADLEVGVDAESADESHRLLPGESGAIDSAAILSALGTLKYDGPVTPLGSPARFAGESREQIVKKAGAALDAVWKAAGIVSRPGMVGSRA